MNRTAFLIFLAVTTVASDGLAQLLRPSFESVVTQTTTALEFDVKPALPIPIGSLAETTSPFMLGSNCLANPAIYGLGIAETEDGLLSLFADTVPARSDAIAFLEGSRAS